MEHIINKIINYAELQANKHCDYVYVLAYNDGDNEPAICAAFQSLDDALHELYEREIDNVTEDSYEAFKDRLCGYGQWWYQERSYYVERVGMTYKR